MQYTCLLHENCEENYCEEIKQTKEHQPGKPVSENVVPATIEKEGSYEEVCYCSVCKKELSRKKKTIPKLTKEENTTSDGDKQSAANQEQNNKKVTVKATTLKKVVNKKTKKIEVTWKKVKGVTGYVQYSTNKSFKKGVHTKKIKGASKVKVTVKKLKKKKRYYVRVRAYKKVGGKKYVSKWSKKKSVKIVR